MATFQHPVGGSISEIVYKMATAETAALLNPERDTSGLRQRFTTEDSDSDWNPELPYGGKVYLARRKKPDPTHVRLLEGLALCLIITFAHLGYSSAQHQAGQRYLHGKGVEKHHEKAMQWFRKAAQEGHPHASYNPAIGHLKGYKTDVKSGEAHQLIHHAASKGVKQTHNSTNKGKGVGKHHGKTMQWFRKAAQEAHAHASYNLAIGHLKGYKIDVKSGKAAQEAHAHASYNLAIGHLKGYKTDVKSGEAHQLIYHAASKGVKQTHNSTNKGVWQGTL